jgi:HEAT repeats/Putative zinc-finger
MKCGEVVEQFSFYSYGEVSSEVEERIESHLAACADCRLALAKHRSFMEALDRREDVMEAALLTTCRADFRRQLAAESVRNARSWSWGGGFENLRNFWQFHIPLRIPVGAMALVAIGWFGARYTPEKFGGIRAGLTQPMFSNVRSIEAGTAGKVQIAVDEVQRRVVTGSLAEPRIQELLLNAVREESNPGVRVESIGMLRNSADSEEVRRALIDAVSHDPNAGVRLKALEGLKPYTADASVRKTLADVLLKDDSAGVRVQAIDLLTAHHDDSIVGVLQDVMQREDDGYIRTRCRDLLQAMKASVGTY